ncbi:hypothetical protein ACFL6C_04945 [Myxococcota bacterium]
MRALLVSAMAALFLFAGCGATDIGEECDTRGSTDECVDGGICDKIDEKAICLKICEDDDACAASEDCNGVSDSNVKACFPKE